MLDLGFLLVGKVIRFGMADQCFEGRANFLVEIDTVRTRKINLAFMGGLSQRENLHNHKRTVK